MPNGNGITLARRTGFWKTGLVGTGNPVVYAHNLGVIPTLVQVNLRDTLGAANQYTLTYDVNNITVTATLNAVFDILADVAE